MNLTDVLQELADQAGTIEEVNVYPYAAQKPAAPAVVFSLPDTVDYDTTFGRGTDRMTVTMWVLVGRSSDQSSHQDIAEYANGSGAKSIKQVLEAGTYTACDVVTVTSVTFAFIDNWGGSNFLAAEFSLDIIGAGS